MPPPCPDCDAIAKMGSQNEIWWWAPEAMLVYFEALGHFNAILHHLVPCWVFSQVGAKRAQMANTSKDN
eukprot:2953023-Karenia_brevis.AAC.1